MDSGIGISVIGRDDDIAVIYVKDPPQTMGIAYYTFAALAENGIDVDLIIQTSTGGTNGDIIFTVRADDAEKTKSVLSALFRASAHTTVRADTDIAKLTVSGAGMQGKPGVAAKVFRCLWDAGVQIINISTSEIKISLLISASDAERATRELYDKFNLII